MSLFTPTDPRGPDRRRKQLMAKLAQQWGRGVPMPAMAGHMGGGSQFRGVGNFRPPSTHGLNVASSVLQRLGIGGQPGAGEFSPGPGAPISHIGTGVDPYSTAPAYISGGTPIAPGGGGNLPGGGSVLPPAVPPPFGSGAPGSPSGFPSWTPPDAGQPGAGLPGGAVPLGNGMFYDPVTDRVVQGTTNPAEGAHGLYRS